MHTGYAANCDILEASGLKEHIALPYARHIETRSVETEVPGQTVVQLVPDTEIMNLLSRFLVKLCSRFNISLLTEVKNTFSPENFP